MCTPVHHSCILNVFIFSPFLTKRKYFSKHNYITHTQGHSNKIVAIVIKYLAYNIERCMR
jgi:hypothetical protein